MAKEFYPERNSRLGSKLEYGAFLGVLIKRLVEKGKTVNLAWEAVCSDSYELGYYMDSRYFMNGFEPTGSREICGFCDLGNTIKILAWNTEAYGFWMAGGLYNSNSILNPPADLSLFDNRNVNLNFSVGWLVLS